MLCGSLGGGGEREDNMMTSRPGWWSHNIDYVVKPQILVTIDAGSGCLRINHDKIRSREWHAGVTRGQGYLLLFTVPGNGGGYICLTVSVCLSPLANKIASIVWILGNPDDSVWQFVTWMSWAVTLCDRELSCHVTSPLASVRDVITVINLTNTYHVNNCLYIMKS